MATVQLALPPSDTEPRIVQKAMAQLQIGDSVQVSGRHAAVGDATHVGTSRSDAQR